MKLYNALVKKDSHGNIEDLVLIKEGHSLRALFFGFAWFLYHKMWKSALILFVVSSLIININSFYFFSELGSDGKAILSIFFSLIISINANYWLSEHLEKKGYSFAGTTFAMTEIEAHIRFSEKYPLKGSSKIDKSPTSIIEDIKKLPILKLFKK